MTPKLPPPSLQQAVQHTQQHAQQHCQHRSLQLCTWFDLHMCMRICGICIGMCNPHLRSAAVRMLAHCGAMAAAVC